MTVDTVPQEALTGRPDSVIWACTQEAERLLITQDLDFSDVRRFAPNAQWHPPRASGSSFPSRIVGSSRDAFPE